MAVVTLDKLEVGAEGKIKEFHSVLIGSKMVEMGFIPGKLATVISKAPFKGPMAIQIQSTILSLRIKEAKTIEMEVVE